MKYEKRQRYSLEKTFSDFSTKDATFLQGEINDIEVLLVLHSLKHFLYLTCCLQH